MPPPMPNPAKRFTANPARPVGRYRPGKPVAEQESSDEEESEEEEQQHQQSQKPPQRRPQPRRPQPAKPQAQRQEESEDEDEEGFVTDDEDATTATAPKVTAPQNKAQTPSSRPADIKQESEAEEDESEDESSEDEEDEESSEDDAPRRKFQRPTFIKKSDRNLSSTPQASNATPEAITNGTPVPDPEMDTQTRRLAQAELLIKDKLERDAIARAQGKKAWDDDDDVLPESMVDDTDGLDPEGEYQAWKLRELKRLKRDREALIAREKEIEEIERRRNLTAEEREKEDKEYLEKQKAEREENRHEASYLARYHHKGAFFQGDEAAEVLKRRDVMGARFEDQVSDKSALPEYMRIRDMTKLGKKGRTRYTDMKNEDTGRFGEEALMSGSYLMITEVEGRLARRVQMRVLLPHGAREATTMIGTETGIRTLIGPEREAGIGEVMSPAGGIRTETRGNAHILDQDLVRGRLGDGREIILTSGTRENVATTNTETA